MFVMKKKKILLVCDKNPCTSFGRLTLDIRKSLESKNFSVEILWLVTPKYFPEGAPETGISIDAKSLYLGYFKFKRPFARVLKNYQPSIVLFIRPELGFLVPLAKNAKTVVMVHDTFAETLYKGSIKFALINRFFVNGTRFADAFLYNSEYTRIESEKYFGMPRQGGFIVGCPVDQALFCKAENTLSVTERRAYFEKLGVNARGGVCLNISLDEPRKNLDTFFNVAAMRPDIAFVRVGKLRKKTKEKLDGMQLQNVYHFENLPSRTLVEFYRNADLFMYPSLLEGFGLPPLEALACGTPVVASGTSAIKENLEGVVPLVTPATDASAYAGILEGVLNGDKKMDTEKISGVLKRFSLDSFADRIAAAMDSL